MRDLSSRTNSGPGKSRDGPSCAIFWNRAVFNVHGMGCGVWGWMTGEVRRC